MLQHVLVGMLSSSLALNGHLISTVTLVTTMWTGEAARYRRSQVTNRRH